MHDRAKMLYDRHKGPKCERRRQVSLLYYVCDLCFRLMVTDRLGQHFVAFVKENGRLWELEGSRVSKLPLLPSFSPPSSAALSFPPILVIALEFYKSNRENRKGQ
jgi:hypothetical protein